MKMKKILLVLMLIVFSLFLRGSANADFFSKTSGFEYTVVCEPCDPVVFPCEFDFLGDIGLVCRYVSIQEGAPTIENSPYIGTSGYHTFVCEGCDPVSFPCEYDFLGGIGLACKFQ